MTTILQYFTYLFLSMLLRTFATAHERRAILGSQHQSHHTLITGIGPEQTLVSLTQYLTLHPSITHIVNIGIAGWTGDINPSTLYHIRTARHQASDKEYISSQSLMFPSAHCLCISRPQTTIPSYNPRIYPGILVDMESWAIGWLAQTFHRHSLILKVPFDQLGSDVLVHFDPQQASAHLQTIWTQAQGMTHVIHRYDTTQPPNLSFPLPRGVRATYSQTKQRETLAYRYHVLTKKTITDEQGREGLGIRDLLAWANGLCDDAKKIDGV